jgi:hypothetical protein
MYYASELNEYTSSASVSNSFRAASSPPQISFSRFPNLLQRPTNKGEKHKTI